MFNKAVEFPRNQVTITPSNSVDLPRPMIIYCGSAGAIAVVDANDTVVVYALAAGQVVPVLAKRVNATGTDSTQVIGLY